MHIKLKHDLIDDMREHYPLIIRADTHSSIHAFTENGFVDKEIINAENEHCILKIYKYNSRTLECQIEFINSGNSLEVEIETNSLFAKTELPSESIISYTYRYKKCVIINHRYIRDTIDIDKLIKNEYLINLNEQEVVEDKFILIINHCNFKLNQIINFKKALEICDYFNHMENCIFTNSSIINSTKTIFNVELLKNE